MHILKKQQCSVVLVMIIALGAGGSALSREQSLATTRSSIRTTQTPAGLTTSAGAAPTTQVTPRDPKDLLLAAEQVNGLGAPGLKPWHILVSYERFDEDGDNVDSGTYEEFWAGDKQYKVSYRSHDFTQTDIATEKGLFRTGEAKWPGELQIRVRDEFVRPMFREMDLQDAKLEKKMREFGAVQLTCVLLRANGGRVMISPIGAVPGFCFEPDSLMLRYSKGGMSALTTWEQTAYDKIVRFQGRYIAGDVRVAQGGKANIKMHLDKLEVIRQPSEADFTTPPNAVAVNEELVRLDGRVLLLDYELHREMPHYPKSIHAPGGAATMKFVIGKDGRVKEMEFIEGTSEMQKGLEESLKKFVYRPFLVRGEPVEVEVKQKFIYEIH
jgi:hypothetical protein